MAKVVLPKDFEPLEAKPKDRVLSEVAYMILSGNYRPVTDGDRREPNS